MTLPGDDDELAPIVELRRVHDDPTDELLEALAGRHRIEGADADDLLASLTNALPNPPLALRIGIAVLATAQLVVVLPWLVDADPFGLLGDSSDGHLTRDGALGLAVAVAALLTAWRPRWALPSFLIASAALIAQTAAGIIDSSPSPGANELIHLPSIALACLTGLAGIRLRHLGPTRQPSRGRPQA
ncbi:MAG: hypothetical protein R2733_06425 [Acidimicrobiales bacterium]